MRRVRVGWLRCFAVLRESRVPRGWCYRVVNGKAANREIVALSPSQSETVSVAVMDWVTVEAVCERGDPSRGRGKAKRGFAQRRRVAKRTQGRQSGRFAWRRAVLGSGPLGDIGQPGEARLSFALPLRLWCVRPSLANLVN